MEKIKPFETEKKFNLNDLKNIISEYSNTGDFSDALCNSKHIEYTTDHGQKVNSLSGDCVHWVNRLQDFLEKNNINSRVVKSEKDCVHSFLKVSTDKGEMVVDPTLGQFVYFPNVFIGSLEELRAIFLDPEREFFCGKRLWAVENEILSREEWFDILYRH